MRLSLFRLVSSLLPRRARRAAHRTIPLTGYLLLAAAIPVAALGNGNKSAPATPPASLVPAAPGTAPNYWCTWFIQNYQSFQNGDPFEIQALEGHSGYELARDSLDENLVLGEQGWARRFFPDARADMFFLLDLGWAEGGLFTLELDRARFPSFPGEPRERLKQLNQAVRTLGWRGLAVWVRGDIPYEKVAPLVEWSRYAGVKYWKIDGGDTRAFNTAKAAQAIYPELVLEYATVVTGSLNNDPGPGFPSDYATTKAAQARAVLTNATVLRTYDVTATLSVPTTLQRAWDVLKLAEGQESHRALINIEDEVYMAAVLGCAMAIHRHPESGRRRHPQAGDVDAFINGDRNTKRRLDEATRALRWQRIAPPLPANEGFLRSSEQRLEDEWSFKRGDTFSPKVIGRSIRQSAPAIVARNLELPVVRGAGAPPYVVASRFPNGAVAIGTLGRCQPDASWIEPEAEITLTLGEGHAPIGIFGRYASLTLLFETSLAGKRIIAQDLLDNQAHDITDQVEIDGRRLTLRKAIIESIGLMKATPGDISSPGLVLKVVP